MSNERSPRGLCSTTIGTRGMGYPFDNLVGCQFTIATNWLSKERAMAARREIEIEASPEEVWEALATEEGRERWLDEPAREIHVESEEPPHRLVWWWWSGDEPATRVEFLVVAAPAGARVRGRASPRRRSRSPAGGALRAGPRRDATRSGPSSRRSPTRRAATSSRRSCARARRASRRSPPRCRSPARRSPSTSPRSTRRGWSSARRAGPARCATACGPARSRPASAWLRETAAAWDERLVRLKGAVEGRGSG